MSGSLGAEFVVPRLRGRFGRPYVYAEVCPSTQRLLGPEHSEGAVAVAEEQTRGTRPARPHVALAAAARASSARSFSSRRSRRDRLPELSARRRRSVRRGDLHGHGARAGDQASERHPARRPQGRPAFSRRRARAGSCWASGSTSTCRPDELPAEIDKPATSLLVETGAEVDRAQLLVELLFALELRYDLWVDGGRYGYVSVRPSFPAKSRAAAVNDEKAPPGAILKRPGMRRRRVTVRLPSKITVTSAGSLILNVSGEDERSRRRGPVLSTAKGTVCFVVRDGRSRAQIGPVLPLTDDAPEAPVPLDRLRSRLELAR